MEASSPFGTAILRSLYAAVVTGLLAGLTAMQTGQGDRDALITGLIAALSVMAMRGGVEGWRDQRRADRGDLSAGDVPMASPRVDVVRRP